MLEECGQADKRSKGAKLRKVLRHRTGNENHSGWGHTVQGSMASAGGISVPTAAHACVLPSLSAQGATLCRRSEGVRRGQVVCVHQEAEGRIEAIHWRPALLGRRRWLGAGSNLQHRSQHAEQRFKGTSSLPRQHSRQSATESRGLNSLAGQPCALKPPPLPPPRHRPPPTHPSPAQASVSVCIHLLLAHAQQRRAVRGGVVQPVLVNVLDDRVGEEVLDRPALLQLVPDLQVRGRGCGIVLRENLHELGSGRGKAAMGPSPGVLPGQRTRRAAQHTSHKHAH